MKKGEIVCSGKPSECICSELIKDVYGIDCNVSCRNKNYYVDVI